MRRFTLSAVPVILAIGWFVAPAAGQSVAAVELRTGTETGLAGAPLMAGLAATWYRPPYIPFAAVRGAFGVSLASTDPAGMSAAAEAAGYRAFAVDLDLLLEPDHAGRAAAPIGALDPVVFGGLGLRTMVEDDGDGWVTPVVSYGGGLRYWAAPALRVTADARRRFTLSEIETATEDFDRAGWSLRLGLAYHFGVRFTGTPAVAAAPARPAPDTIRLSPGRDAAPAGSPGDDGAAAWRTMDIDATRSAALRTAEDLLGTPYVWGGGEPVPGFDCSGFVQYVYAQAGIDLPRPSRIMATVGQPLPTALDSLQPGDLMFFSKSGLPNQVTHVGIYAGGTRFLHATGSGGGVAYDDLTTPRGRWFAERIVGAARVVGVPIQRTRSRVPLTPQTWDPVWDGAPPKEGVDVPEGGS